MNPDLIPVIIAVIAVIPGSLALIGQLRKDKAEQKQKQEAHNLNQQGVYIDNAGKLTGTAMQLIDKMNERVNELETEQALMQERITMQERRIDKLSNGVRILTNQIIGLGHQPVWVLEDK